MPRSRRCPGAVQPRRRGKQLGPGLAPAAQGHLRAAAQEVLDDGQAHESRATKDEDPDDCRGYRRPVPGQAVRARTSSTTAQDTSTTAPNTSPVIPPRRRRARRRSRSPAHSPASTAMTPRTAGCQPHAAAAVAAVTATRAAAVAILARAVVAPATSAPNPSGLAAGEPGPVASTTAARPVTAATARAAASGQPD